MKKFTGAIRAYWDVTDRWLLFFWAGASALSLLFLWAIDVYPRWPENYSITMQLFAVPMGIIIAIVISLFDYHTFLKLWKLYVPVVVLLMILTFIFGQGRGDSNVNWLEIPIAGRKISMQPSEFLKLAFITTFSMHLSKVRGEMNHIANLALLALHGGAYIALMFQDAGTMLVFMIMFVSMLFCAGIQWRYILAGTAVVGIATPLLWDKLLSYDQIMRIQVLKQPEISPRYAYQQAMGLAALGTGGRQGAGLFTDSHVHVPEACNDMIFTFIGETSGFIGALGVMGLLLVISLKILYNSGHAKDDTGRFICVGVFSMIISQTFINLGMCLRLLPVIGITLPLFSSGGTSVLALYIGLGLVLSVYRNSSTGLFSEKGN